MTERKKIIISFTKFHCQTTFPASHKTEKAKLMWEFKLMRAVSIATQSVLRRWSSSRRTRERKNIRNLHITFSVYIILNQSEAHASQRFKVKVWSWKKFVYYFCLFLQILRPPPALKMITKSLQVFKKPIYLRVN